MWNPFSCKCCKVKDSEIDHLRGLVDRMMVQIAPKQFEPGEDIDIIPEDENQSET